MLSSAAIKQHAAELGFDLCGISPVDSFPELTFLPEWLQRGYAGEMSYLHKSAERRADIRRFLPSARSVIVTGTIYNTEQASGIRPQASAETSATIRVAKYAWGDDYHNVLTERLITLLQWMRKQHPDEFDADLFVDKHHVQERVYGLHAGLGWIGKNSMLINRERGSYFFLAGIATSLELQADAPQLDQCGSCTLCIDSCPTAAIVDDHVVDATKCISYLTIEVDGSVPEEQRPLIGNHAYGCDVCQDVCPWNLAPPVTGDPAWHARRRDGLSAAELWQRSDDDLHRLIEGSAMTYVPLSRLRRNLATVIGNSGDRNLLDVLDRPGHGKKNAARSAETPVVEDAVAWARRRLSDGPQ